MRPLWIELKNFGQYTTQRINLEGISAATIVGPTGAGKSIGFMESITWCFYLQCRLSDPDGFIKTGQTDAAVTVCFEMKGEVYRATRTRSIRTKRGKTEFHIHRQVGEEWDPVDRDIEALVGADYDALTASNFFLQEDPFDLCKAKPKDRIGLVAKILKLERFEERAKLANKKANTAAGELKVKLEQREWAAAAEAKYQESVKALESLEESMVTINTQIAEEEKKRDELTKRQATLEATLSAMPTVNTVALEAEHGHLKWEMLALAAKINETKAIAAREPGLLEKQAAMEKNESLLKELEASRQAKVEELSRARPKVEAATEILQLLKDDQAAKIAEKGKLEYEVRVVSDGMAEYKKETARIERDIEAATNQTEVLNGLPCDDGLQRQCPLVKAAKHTKERLLPDLRGMLAIRSNKELNEAMARVKAALQESVTKLESVSERLNGGGTLNVYNAKQEEAKAQTAVNDLDRQMNDIRRLSELARAEVKDLPKVQHAKEIWPQMQTDLERKVEAVNVAKQAIDTAKVDVFKRERLNSDKLNMELHLVESLGQRERLKVIRSEYEGEVANKRLTIALAKEGRGQLESIERDISVAQREIEEYGHLAEAYRRVPVLMIENVTPVIEEEANKALLRLSLRGMQLRFDSQRELKTVDKTIDEMNIYVRDQDGERVYETYSGGEHGLANFATRLGLTLLTSTRSGSPMETIIVDEAFASMSEEIAQRVRVYLEELADRYKLILIITHDLNLKGSLPAQITVTPGPQGSTVEITEQ